MRKHIAFNCSLFLLVENDAIENDIALYICFIQNTRICKITWLCSFKLIYHWFSVVTKQEKPKNIWWKRIFCSFKWPYLFHQNIQNLRDFTIWNNVSLILVLLPGQRNQKNIDKNKTFHSFFAFQTSYILCFAPQSGAVRRLAYRDFTSHPIVSHPSSPT